MQHFELNKKIKEHNHFEIEFENGAKITTSLDHKFLLDDGVTYLEAHELTENHSIQSF